MPGERPFELSQEELEARIEEMVNATFSDLSSEFLLMPTGTGLVRYPDFQAAYEVLKKNTGGFQDLSPATVKSALQQNSLVLGVLRSVLGMTAPEWAELARVELESDITQGAARGIDKGCKTIDYYQKLIARNTAVKTIERIDALIRVAIQYIEKVRRLNRTAFSIAWPSLTPPMGWSRWSMPPVRTFPMQCFSTNVI
jgi:hypothetical protein